MRFGQRSGVVGDADGVVLVLQGDEDRSGGPIGRYDDPAEQGILVESVEEGGRIADGCSSVPGRCRPG
jgi:hypothetical protein